MTHWDQEDKAMKDHTKNDIRSIQPTDHWLTYMEAASYAHISKRTIIRWVKSGKLRAKYVFGRNPRISFTTLQWTIDRMPLVKGLSQQTPSLLSSKDQEAGAEGGSHADQRPA